MQQAPLGTDAAQLQCACSTIGLGGCWTSPVPGGIFGVLWPGGSSGGDAHRGRWWLCPVGMGLWWRTGSRKQRAGAPAAARCRSHHGDPSCAMTQCLHCCGGVTRWFWGGNVPWLMFVLSMPCPQTPRALLSMAQRLKWGESPRGRAGLRFQPVEGLFCCLLGGFVVFGTGDGAAV